MMIASNSFSPFRVHLFFSSLTWSVSGERQTDSSARIVAHQRAIQAGDYDPEVDALDPCARTAKDSPLRSMVPDDEMGRPSFNMPVSDAIMERVRSVSTSVSDGEYEKRTTLTRVNTNMHRFIRVKPYSFESNPSYQPRITLYQHS